MSRYPFKQRVNEVIRAYTGVHADSTLEIEKRRYNRMNHEFTSLQKDGKVSSVDPSRFTVDDINSFYLLLKNKGISPNTISHELSALHLLCSYYGNSSVNFFIAKHPYAKKKNRGNRLPSLDPADILTIINAAREVDENDFFKLRSYAIVICFLCGGLRSIELQHAKAEHFRIKGSNAVLYLDVVKGVESYGEPRHVPFIPAGVPVMIRYLEARKRFLEDNKKETPYLFFSSNQFDFLSSNTIRKIRSNVEDDLGIKFDGRMCRRTYGQYLKDQGVTIESISVTMGHNSTKTTEHYYARLRQDRAIDEVFEVFGGKS